MQLYAGPISSRALSEAFDVRPLPSNETMAVLRAETHTFPSEAMSGKQLALAIGGLLICIFLAAIDSSIVNTALPRIASELRGFELYAWVTTGYLLSSTAVVPVAGKLGDRYGRQPP